MTIKKELLEIEINGLVQGLGFRPFVYRLANRYQQKGWVFNTNKGVSISIAGIHQHQKYFLDALQNQLPPFAKIHSLTIQQKPWVKFDSFQIKPSSTNGQYSSFVLPDISPCNECITDLFNPQSRFYRYPFTSCCYCGPRYSIMDQQPFDRIRTSMAKFTACPACMSEYNAPYDRRFHSQTIACSMCGPQLSLLDRAGKKIQQNELALAQVVNFLKQGKIIAIKGIGGFQLVADATNPAVVAKLRLRKQRPEKPFAVLVANLSSANSLCYICKTEQQALTSYARPIVLLRRSDSGNIAESVAPNNNLLGIMLPSSPLHHLLIHDFNNPLIATSGNRKNQPICITEQQALEQLVDIADLFLTHDRTILRPLDDSIIRIINNKPTLFRRARGYTPMAVIISKELPDALAVGAQMKNTVAISKGKQLILSQHIGELSSAPSQQQFQQTLQDLQKFYATKPTTIVHDLHPDYHSSQYAYQQKTHKMAVQHHHAHILSCMAEHDLQTPVLGFAWDGSGLGNDGTVWGGECLLLTGSDFIRYAHLRPFPLVGGDKAATEPRRSTLGLLYEIYSEALFEDKKLNFLSSFSQQELELLKQCLNKQLNTPYTSSIGRLFDAISSLLGLCYINQFEGQAAMLLEQMASTMNTEEYYPYLLMEGESIVIDWELTITTLLNDLNQQNKNLISAKFHNTLAEITLDIAKRVQKNHIILSGGCFQNAYLTERCIMKLESAGFSVYTHEKIPPNDGGLALGQLYAATLKG